MDYLLAAFFKNILFFLLKNIHVGYSPTFFGEQL